MDNRLRAILKATGELPGNIYEAIASLIPKRKTKLSSPIPESTPTPKPGYEFISGTNIQAPIGSELLRTGPTFKSGTPQPEVPSAPIKEPTEKKEVEKPEKEPIKKTTLARNPNIDKFRISDEVHDAIQSAAEEFGVPSNLLYDIALQESSFNPNLRNPQLGSTASGLFQFTDDTWETVKNYANQSGSSLKLPSNPNRFDPLTNARAAAYLIKFGQLGRWDASKGVWGQHYDEKELRPFYSQTLNMIE